MSMASRHEVLEDSRARVSTEESEDMIYFAVRKEVNECALNLLWLLRNSGGQRICILHVHQPAKWIPGLVMGAKYPVHALTETQVRKYRDAERREMQNILDEYLRICSQWRVNAQKLCIEMESVEKGIVELIYQHGIRELVMGAAADGRYKKNMTEIRSKKARYVCEKAPAYSHIQFICGGHYILSRQLVPYHSNESTTHANIVIGRSIYQRSVSEQLNRPDRGGTGQHEYGLHSRSATFRHERADSMGTSFFHNIRTSPNGTKKSSSSETSLFSLSPGDISGRPSTVEFGSPSSTSSASSSTRSTSSSNVQNLMERTYQQAQEGWIQRKEVEEMLAKERERFRKELGHITASNQQEESSGSRIQKLQMELENALKELAEVRKGINQLQDSTTS